MTPEEILSHPARVLTQALFRARVYRRGEPRAAKYTSELSHDDRIRRCRPHEHRVGSVFDIGPGHSSDNPVLRRQKDPMTGMRPIGISPGVSWPMLRPTWSVPTSFSAIRN